MNKLYITEPGAIDPDAVRQLLPSDWQVVLGDTSFSGNDIQDCTALLIRSATSVTASIKTIFPNLRSVVRVGVGLDNVDTEFCKREGIAVYNAPGANADAVSDYVVAMMFHSLRNLHLLTRQDVADWNRFKFTGHSLAGRSVGIVGFGNIGKQIFAKLQGFAISEYHVYDPFIKADDLPDGVTYAGSVDDVLRQSDIVTLHVPLLPTTKYMIHKDNLSLLSEGAVLINASRGGIVNEADVVAYAQDHKLVYVADTVENEPHVSEALLDVPSVIVTPHIASLTQEADDNVLRVALQNLLAGKNTN